MAKEIYDTVLSAAAFCMYNRYVDGLATWAPQDPELYRRQGARLGSSAQALADVRAAPTLRATA